MNENLIETRNIPVTIDKSHLVTIGEKLYTEKLSFLRELVNNAYDADATEVRVQITPNSIIIADNGSGMDEQGLRQYFTIGSTLKKAENFSPQFRRQRIGEFGIGKFAALAACKKFEVVTQRGGFHARLIFDKESWSKHEDWHLNIDILDLFSFSFTRPILSGTSFAIKMFLPIGKAMCIILFASFSATGNSGLAMSLKRIIFVNSPPNTDL